MANKRVITIEKNEQESEDIEITINEYIRKLIDLGGKQNILDRFDIMFNELDKHIKSNKIGKDNVITDIPIVLKCIINEIKELY